MNAPLNIAMPAEASAAPKSYRLLIDGKHVDARDGRTLERNSPGHGFIVSRYAQAGEAEVEAAVQAAHKAFETGPWPRMKAAERAAILLKAADLIEAQLEDIARLDALESGKPIAQARGEIGGAVDIWRYAASLARTLHGESYANLGDAMLGVVLREPIGVVSIITPWNFPFLIVSQKLPFALAAGCTAVVKPSEMTSASTFVLGDILMQAGLPAGVVNILAGLGADVGAPMVSHPLVEMVSFTGSTRVGKMTMASAASSLKKVSMELGGKNGQIVFPDADLEAAADAAVFGGFFNAGECCNAGSRLIVHEAIADDFLAAVKALTAKGDGRRSARRPHQGRRDDLVRPSHQGSRLRHGGGKRRQQRLQRRQATGVQCRPIPRPDHHSRRDRGHGDRARRSVRPGAFRADF